MIQEYICKISGDTSDLAKALNKVKGSIKELENDEVLIKLDYDGNIQGFNKTFDSILKQCPDLTIQFQYDANTKILNKEISKLNQLNDLKIDIETGGTEKKLKSLFSDLKTFAEKDSSNDIIEAKIKNIYKYANTISGLGIKISDTIEEGIYDAVYGTKFEDLFNKILDNIDLSDYKLFDFDFASDLDEEISKTEKNIKEFKSFLEQLETKGAKVKGSSELQEIQDEIKILRSDLSDMKDELGSISGERFNRLAEDIKDVNFQLQEALDKLARLSGDTTIDNVISKWQSQPITKTNERYTGFNSSTLQTSGVHLAADAAGVSENLIRKSIEEMEGAADGFIHTHPERFAAFSDTDLEAYFKLFDEGLTKQIITSSDEVMSLDLSKINMSYKDEIISHIKQRFEEIEQNDIYETNISKYLDELKYNLENLSLSTNSIPKDVLDTFKKKYNDTLSNLGESFTGNDLFDGIDNTIRETLKESSAYKDASDELKKKIRIGLTEISPELLGSINDYFSDAQQIGFQKELISVFSNTKYLKEGVKTAIGLQDIDSFKEDAKKGFIEIGNGIAEGIIIGFEKIDIAKSKEKVRDAVEELVTVAEQATAKAQDSHSPSKVAEKLGEYWGEGYSQGIINHKEDVENAVRVLIDAGKLTAQQILDDMPNIFGDLKYSDLVVPINKILSENFDKNGDPISKITSDQKELKEEIEKTNEELKEQNKIQEDNKIDIVDEKELNEFDELYESLLKVKNVLDDLTSDNNYDLLGFDSLNDVLPLLKQLQDLDLSKIGKFDKSLKKVSDEIIDAVDLGVKYAQGEINPDEWEAQHGQPIDTKAIDAIEDLSSLMDKIVEKADKYKQSMSEVKPIDDNNFSLSDEETEVQSLHDGLVKLRDLKIELSKIDTSSEDGIDDAYDIMHQIQIIEDKLSELYSFNKNHHLIDASSTIDDINKIENRIDQFVNGKIIKMYRGVDDPTHSIESLGIHGGGTFFTDDLQSAQYYGQNGKLYEAELMIKDALEFIPDVNSMVDAVTFTGDGKDEISKKLKSAIQFIEESGYSLSQFRNILMERYDEFQDGSDFIIPFDTLDEGLKDALQTIVKISEDANNIYGVYRTTDTFAEKAQANGYDSLVIHDIAEAFNEAGEEIKSTIAVIFEAKQILSSLDITSNENNFSLDEVSDTDYQKLRDIVDLVNQANLPELFGEDSSKKAIELLKQFKDTYEGILITFRDGTQELVSLDDYDLIQSVIADIGTEGKEKFQQANISAVEFKETLKEISDANETPASKASPTQEFDNEIQQNLVMLENYENTIKEIDKLKLDPETDEIKAKIEELNKLADYFASKITTIRSENGHEINKSMMYFNGFPNENLRTHYSTEDIKRFDKVAGDRTGLNIDKVSSEFNGIAQEIENIESKSESLRHSLEKDLSASSEYVNHLETKFLDLVDSWNELKISTDSTDIQDYKEWIDEILNKYPELEQFKDKFISLGSAREFTQSDKWLDFLATLPQAHKYLEELGYDFNRINTQTIDSSELDKANQELEEARTNLANSEAEAESLRQQLNASADEVGHLTEEIGRLESALSDERDISGSASSKYFEESAKNDELQKQIDQLEDSNAKLEEERANLIAELERAESRYQEKQIQDQAETNNSLIEEKEKLELLGEALREVSNLVDIKTDAFENERIAVVNALDQEISKLEELRLNLNTVTDLLNTPIRLHIEDSNLDSLQHIDLGVENLNRQKAEIEASIKQLDSLLNVFRNFKAKDVSSIKSFLKGLSDITWSEIRIPPSLAGKLQDLVLSVQYADKTSFNRVRDFLTSLGEIKNLNSVRANLVNVAEGLRLIVEQIKDPSISQALVALKDTVSVLDKLGKTEIKNVAKTTSSSKKTAEEKAAEKARKEAEKEAEKARKEEEKAVKNNEKVYDSYIDKFKKLKREFESYKTQTNDMENPFGMSDEGLEKASEKIREIESKIDELNNLKTEGKVLTEKEIEEYENLVSEAEKYKKTLLSTYEYKKNTQITNSLKKIGSLLNKNTAYSKEARRELESLYDELDSSKGKIAASRLSEINSRINEIIASEERAGRSGASFWRKTLGFIDQANQRFLSQYFSWMDIIRYARTVAQTVVEVDTALTELRKVSDATSQRLIQNFEKSTETAIELGSTITDVISVTSDWARLGYNVDQAEELARVTTLFKNVGDNMSAEDASSYLISTLQGFHLAADDAEDVIDKYNEVANNFAIDTAGIGEALKRSSASLYAANTDLSKSIALVTTANTVLQDPDSVGTVFKTMSARIRGAKTELEELGEEEDDFTKTTSKLRDLVKGLTGFDIMEDEDTFKDIYEILIGIGEQWDKLTDVERQSLAEALAGKRGAQAFYAVIQNIDTLKRAYETAENASGSAAKEQENYSQSIQYSIDQFKASAQELFATLIDSGLLKDVIDFGTKLVQILTDIVDKLGSKGTLGLLTTIFGLDIFRKNANIGLFQILKQIPEFIKGFDEGGKALETIVEASDDVVDVLSSGTGLSTTLKNTMQVSEEFVDVSEDIVDIAYKEAPAVKTLSGGIRGLSKAFVSALPAIGAFVIALGALYSAYRIQNQYARDASAAKDLADDFNNTKESIEKAKGEIEDYYKIINDNKSSYEEVTEARKGLLDVQDTLIKNFGDEEESILNINEAIYGQIDALDKLSDKKWKQSLDDFNSYKDEDSTLTDKIFGKIRDGIKGFIKDPTGNKKYSRSDSLLEDYFNVKEDLASGVSSGYEWDADFLPLTTKELKEFKKELKDIGFIVEDAKDDANLFKVSFEGTAKEGKEALEKYNKLYEKYHLEDAEIFGLGDFTKNLEDTIGKLEDSEEFVNQLVLREQILPNKQYKEVYDNLNKAVDNYKKAFEEGNEETIDKALGDIQNVLDSLGEDAPVEILSWFENAVEGFQPLLDQYNFKINVLPNILGLDDFKNGGFTEKDILDMVTTKGLQEGEAVFNDIKLQMEEAGLVTKGASNEVEEIIRLLKDFGIIVDQEMEEAVASTNHWDEALKAALEDLGKTVEDEEFTNYVKALLELNPDFNGNEETAQRVALANLQFSKGVEDLQSNFEKYQEVLKENNKLSVEYNDTIINLAKDLTYLTGVDFSVTDAEKWSQDQNNIQLLTEALEGSEEALKRLREESQQFFTVDLNDEDVKNRIKNISSTIEKELEKLEKGGNVNLNLRPQISAEEMQKAGWKDFTDEYATVFSSTFSNEAGNVAINFTPIMVDPKSGKKIGILSPDQLQTYAENVINGVHEDYFNLQIGAEFTGEDAIQQAVEAAEKIHNLHEAQIELGLNTETFNEEFANVLTWMEENSDLGVISATANLDDAPFLATLVSLASQSSETAKAIQAMFDAMGWDMTWDTKKMFVPNENGSTLASGGMPSNVAKYQRGYNTSKGGVYGELKPIDVPTNIRFTKRGSTTGTINSQTPKSIPQSSKSGSSGSDGGGGSESEPQEEVFDWIETRIARLERDIQNFDKVVNASYKNWGERLGAIPAEMSAITDQIDTQYAAYTKYMQEANAVGLAENWANAVRNGTLDISRITDDALKEQINNYKQWYEKALEAQDKIEDLRGSLANLAQVRFDSIANQFDGIIERITHATDIVNSIMDMTESQGYILGKSYYQNLTELEEQNLSRLQEKYDELVKAQEDAVNSGAIEKYSEQWMGMQSSIEGVESAIYDAKKALVDYAEAMRQIDWDLFDRTQNYISNIFDESDWLQDLIRTEHKITDEETGRLNRYGRTIGGLIAVDYNGYMAQSQMYAKEIEKINKELANDPYNSKLIDRRNELLKLQRQSIKAAEDEKEAIRSLIKESYDEMLRILQELIDKRKEALQAEKDLYDYQKNVKKQADNIASLQKQLMALGGDESEENKARLQKLTNDLNEAQEELADTEYEKWLNDQTRLLDDLYDDAEQLLNERLDNLDGLVQEVIDTTNLCTEEIRDTISEEVQEVGYTLSNEMQAIWYQENAVVSAFHGDFVNYGTNVLNVIGSINQFTASMLAVGNQIAAQQIEVANAYGSYINSLAAQVNAANQAAIAAAQSSSGGSGGYSGGSSGGSGSPNNGFDTWYYNADSGKQYELIQNQIKAQNNKPALDWQYQRTKEYQQKITNDLRSTKHGKNGLYAEGGTIGKAIKGLGEDGIILAKTGEEVLSLEKVKMMKDVLQAFNPLAETINKIPRVSSGTLTSSINGNEINVSFNLPNVTNYEEFINTARTDSRFERIIQQMTLGSAMGQNSLKKYTL